MHILEFIRRARPVDIWAMALLSTLSGVANAALLMMVNATAAVVGLGNRPSLASGLLFIAIFVAYFQCNWLALQRANGTIETLLKALRLQLIDRLRQSELAVVDRLGRGHLYNLISQETNHLSVAFPLLVDCFQQAVLLSIALLYLLWLSEAAFLVFIGAVAIGVVTYRHINAAHRETMAAAAARQGQLLDAVGDVVSGFKEVRLNTRRSEALRDAFARISDAVQETRRAMGEHWAALILLSSVVVYFMLGTVSFVLPGYLSSHGQIVFELVPTLLFCIGPLSKIVALSPMFLQAEASLRNMQAVQRQLDAAIPIAPALAREEAPAFHSFQRIELRGMVYSRRDPDGTVGFTSGPLDFEIRRGEVLFLVGGNGSGKSTALRLCTGLLQPDAGYIVVDGVPLMGRAMAGYRELFAAVFADFHLFDRLYGLERAPPARVRALIAEMGLEHKVRFEDGRFSTIDLSTGQRKRLGLIVALLEDRPILALDEWAAEQDAQFRAYFYNTMIPRLKQEGKTVLAVTHDEMYLDRADRVLTFDLGKVI